MSLHNMSSGWRHMLLQTLYVPLGLNGAFTDGHLYASIPSQMLGSRHSFYYALLHIKNTMRGEKKSQVPRWNFVLDTWLPKTIWNVDSPDCITLPTLGQPISDELGDQRSEQSFWMLLILHLNLYFRCSDVLRQLTMTLLSVPEPPK